MKTVVYGFFGAVLGIALAGGGVAAGWYLRGKLEPRSITIPRRDPAAEGETEEEKHVRSADEQRRQAEADRWQGYNANTAYGIETE